MAAEGEAAKIVGKNEEPLESRRPIIPFLSLIPKFQFKSPASAPEKQQRETEVEATSHDKDGESNSDKRDVVSFPVSQKPREIPPLKLECHEAEKGSNPVVLWQVYALGGFMILRWVWAKWQERKAKKDSGSSRTEDSGEEPPPNRPSD